jgi:uncharacterized membrane protein
LPNLLTDLENNAAKNCAKQSARHTVYLDERVIMLWKVAGLVALILCIATLPVWPYSRGPRGLYLCMFLGFAAALLFLVGFFGRRGSALWKDRGQG